MSGPAEWYTQLPSKEDIIEVLRGARILIQERGWIQDAMTDDDGRLCLLAAIWTAADATTQGISDRVHRQLAAEFAMHRRLGLDVVPWNNQPGRTREQVLDALEETAKQIEDSPEPESEAIYTLVRDKRT